MLPECVIKKVSVNQKPESCGKYSKNKLFCTLKVTIVFVFPHTKISKIFKYFSFVLSLTSFARKIGCGREKTEKSGDGSKTFF